MSFDVAGQMGRLCVRTIRGKKRPYLDFRPYGYVWAIPSPAGGRPMPFTEESARRALESIRADIARGTSAERALAPWLAKVAASQQVLAKAELWLARLEEQVAAGERSPTYVRVLRIYVRNPDYWATYWRDRPIYGITYGDLEDWNAWLAKRGLGPGSRRKTLEAFRTFLRWLRRRGDLSADDVPEFPRVEVPEYAPELLSREDQEAVLAQIPWELRGAYLAARLGMRPGELRGASLGDYSESQGEGWITVHRAQKGDKAASPIREAKEKRVRAIPCDERLRDWIRWRIERLTKEDQLAGRVVLFPNFRATNSAQRWVGVAMRREWRRACKRAGVSPVALYSGTKHSSATHLREAGVPLDQIQQLLGHADRRSTEIYAKLRSPALAKLIRMHHPMKRAEP